MLSPSLKISNSLFFRRCQCRNIRSTRLGKSEGLCSTLKNHEVLDLSFNNFNDGDIAFALGWLSFLNIPHDSSDGLAGGSVVDARNVRDGMAQFVTKFHAWLVSIYGLHFFLNITTCSTHYISMNNEDLFVKFLLVPLFSSKPSEMSLPSLYKKNPPGANRTTEPLCQYPLFSLVDASRVPFLFKVKKSHSSLLWCYSPQPEKK
ncbi:hypothetical protein VNO77_38911 [Canavalia gladiata]|uniref:Uncharacterized protein n=1 Tax=Canavalia gladiata TaxID=3824 RepID=A0AAN9PWN5_CANGL